MRRYLVASAFITTFFVLCCTTVRAQAGGWSRQYDRAQTLTITLNNAFPYTVTIRTVSGGTTRTHTVTGTSKTETWSVAPGTTTIFAQFDAGGGNFRPAAYATCPGPSVKFSFTSHNLNCDAYTDAWVLIQPGS